MLLIAGGANFGVIELNEQALDRLNCIKRLEIVPDTTHLFEELGTLDSVIELADQWFVRHLRSDAS